MKNKNKASDKKTKSEQKMDEKIEATEQKSTEQNTKINDRVYYFRRVRNTPKVIGDAEEIVPFAWRHPLTLQDPKRMTKILKTMVKSENERAMLMPSDESR